MNWTRIDLEHLTDERRMREAKGATAAAAAPAMACEEWMDIGGCATLSLTPKAGGDTGPILFLHGGGWVFGSPVQSLGLARRIAAEAGCQVLSMAYPLAPEHPYPAAIEAVARACDQLGERGSFMLAGGSAGAQIGLAAMALQRDRGGVLPRAALLFCGAFAQTVTGFSHDAFGRAGGRLTSATMADFISVYGVPDDARYADMTKADLSGLPELWLSVGDRDPLLSDTLAVFRASIAGGASSHLEVVPGAAHGFMNDFHADPRIDAAVAAGAGWLAACT